MGVVRDHLQRLVPPSCIELFAVYGIAMKPQTPTPLGRTSAVETSSGGLVRFTASSCSGTLLIVGSFSFFGSSYPPDELRLRTLSTKSAADWLLVRDWAMELSNQLFGRLRNRMYARQGVTLDAKCPTAVSGSSLAVAIRGRPVPDYEFAVSSGGDPEAVRLWMELVETSDEAASERHPSERSDVADEGKLILF